ncbi:branched-chain amino acid ABC transporter ATP-binding protein/permease [Actinomadura nitritigenes]|uniref:ATP-binding cassette domain-containing protein n=1 Tax=Actinomadura nitritigenes TaxID=134602 RepID=A0ABS3R2K8_9ACTN|nr:ATP-binding cassette domain-containing protein [Actinomadura nitritigenes]MBO2440501.1 ATP-binding cassette domain-containing protein [Actinomadura nitritigenes]
MSRPVVVATAAAAVVVLVAPYLTGTYYQQLLAQAFLYAIVAVSLDFVWGYAGVPDLGHALWFGIGALSVGHATTVLSDVGLVTEVHGSFGRYALGTLTGVVAATALAAIVARLCLSSRRSNDFYIVVVTLALATAAVTVYDQTPALGGGENGLFGFNLQDVTPLGWYYITAALLAVTVAVALVVVRSDFGLLMRAVRDNAPRARYLGYNDVNVKIGVFTAGAAVTALAGAVFAMMTGVANDGQFGFTLATSMLVWVAVGGRATIVGPMIGAIVMSLAGAKLNEHFPAQWTIIEGALLIAVVVFVPGGLIGPLVRLAGRLLSRRYPPRGRAVVAAPARPDRPAREPGGGRPLIRIRDLVFGYGSLRVLDGVTLDVVAGELLCVVGPNGAGKSTLTSVVTDRRLRSQGDVEYLLPGHRLGDRPAAHQIARAGVGRKFQIPSVFASLTVAEALLLAGRRGAPPSPWRRSATVEVAPAVVDIVRIAGLDGRADTLSSDLSHGLRQGLEVAMAVAARPRVIILDEPTAGLTAHERHDIGQVLEHLRDIGIAVVLIEHDLDFVIRVSDRVVVLHGGRVIEDGPPETVRGSEVVRSAYLGTAVR